MKPQHAHRYTRSKPSATVETCSCGRFRFTEHAGPAIAGTPVPHTPAPWTFRGGVVVGPDGLGLGASSGRPAGESSANIALACAAPDLLAALREIVRRFDKNDATDALEAIDELARAAIAKAEGRS